MVAWLLQAGRQVHLRVTAGGVAAGGAAGAGAEEASGHATVAESVAPTQAVVVVPLTHVVATRPGRG